MNEASADARWMALALALGARGQGLVAPNPAVGCVIVKGDRVVGRGWTARGGRPHAETMALAQAGSEARGAVAYVTLEPCSHHGKTPPCAEALVKAGLQRVVIAMTDPERRVSGRGIALLKDAGITVTENVMREQAESAHAGFLLRETKGRPFLTLKLASSFDGRIAIATGESQWITGPQSRRMVHALRARHDAVLVGAGTARDDLPALTVRGMGNWNAPIRAVISTALDLPDEGPLMSGMPPPVWIFHGPNCDTKKWSDRGARCFEIPLSAGQVDLSATLAAMGQAGLTRVFCEGGGQLAAGLIKEDLVDEVIGFTSGLMLGGDGLSGIAALDLRQLSDAPRFELIEARRLGEDLMHRWARAEPQTR